MNIQKQHSLLLGAIILAGAAHAGEQNYGSLTPTKEQIIQVFKPDSSTQVETAALGQHVYEGDVDMGKERNISFKLNPSNTKAKAPVMHDPRVKKQVETAISMQIQFDYKSAELTEVAKSRLKPVGEALASNELKNIDFTVEGHTDAIGGDAYNQELSIHRAASVKSFLIGQYRIAADRINAIGKGEHHLLDPHNPDSDVNRRVRIVALK